jgi:hypothetical protein
MPFIAGLGGSDMRFVSDGVAPFALGLCAALAATIFPVVALAQSTPFSGTPIVVPATIEAENFDRGGEGVAYHDSRAGNAGGQYRTTESVDIVSSCDAAGGGYVVNNFSAGEWMKYTISVPTTGNYDIEVRASSKMKASAFHVEVDDVDVTGSIALPSSGSWCAFQWLGKKTVALSAGTHVLKVQVDKQSFDLNQLRVLASAGGVVPPPPPPPGGLPSTGTSAVPTYESAGIYWSAPGSGASSGGCEVKFRKQGDSAWRDGLALWYDGASNECRGSLVHLSPATDYEVQLNLPGQPAARALGFRTWSEVVPVARTVTVSSGATLNITEGGSPGGYVVYQAAPGAVLDAANSAASNVAINASYVVLRGFTLRGAQQDAIRIAPTVTDVVIEDNEITGWGRQRSGSLGVNLDSAIRAVCVEPTLQRVTIQRNRIRDPRYGTNSWSDGHPQGPQGITFSHCGGNHVIRYNEITSPSGRYYNDIIGGEDNHTIRGFPYGDTDIYGNLLQHAWDDGIEAEGANKNVRIWGNYIDSTAISIATTLTSVGPVYIFRNVWNRSRFYERVALDADSRGVFSKSGSTSGFGNGRRYLFHNTMLQATQAGVVYGLGGGAGLGGTGSTRPVNNTVTRNNIFHLWKPVNAFYQIGTGNDFGYDLYSGSLGTTAVGSIQGVPLYASGSGWTSEANGLYQLASNSPGYDRGARIANFNDGFTGAAPDIGAHESGTAAMKFGLGLPPPPVASTPYGGAPFTLPGIIEAENFDRGGEGVGYHDNVAGNAGGQYRTTEDVDIIVSADSAGGGYVVNNFETGEWLAYTVNVASAGTYDIALRVSSTFTGSAFHVEVDGIDVTGRITVPSTGAWSVFQWIGKTGVPLTAGNHVLRVVADQQYFNLNQVRVTASGSTP